MTIAEINIWLSENQLLVSLVLIPAVSALAVWYSAKRAFSSARSERVHQSALEIARFRQTWIDALRNDLAEFAGIQAIMVPSGPPSEKIERVSVLAMRIQLRMNSDDPDYSNLIDTLKATSEQYFFGKKAENESFPPLVPVSQAILKREWDRIKADLERATP